MLEILFFDLILRIIVIIERNLKIVISMLDFGIKEGNVVVDDDFDIRNMFFEIFGFIMILMVNSIYCIIFFCNGDVCELY